MLRFVLLSFAFLLLFFVSFWQVSIAESHGTNLADYRNNNSLKRIFLQINFFGKNDQILKELSAYCDHICLLGLKGK